MKRIHLMLWVTAILLIFVPICYVMTTGITFSNSMSKLLLITAFLCMEISYIINIITKYKQGKSISIVLGLAIGNLIAIISKLFSYF